jgi:hypothetical protein
MNDEKGKRIPIEAGGERRRRQQHLLLLFFGSSSFSFVANEETGIKDSRHE